VEQAIKVEHLSKRYRIGKKQVAGSTFSEKLLSVFKTPFSNLKSLRQLPGDETEAEDILWALRDVSFDVQRGEVLGVVGKNGAGKSTLLKILARITEPSGGRFLINGRIASLLEVGTGFHHELTGRENIFLNGTILGMKRREISRHFDEIVAFSGVEKFIDTPIKRYSSGMKVRLAFAVAAFLEPEILIIDEVLAVGDAEFQKRCLGKMKDISTQGRTILFVSHNMAAVHELCTSCILLQQGQFTMKSSPAETIKYYLDASYLPDAERSNLATLPRSSAAYGKKALIQSFSLKSKTFYWKDAVELEFSVELLDKSLTEIEFGFGVDAATGVRVCTYESEQAFPVKGSEFSFKVKMTEPRFVPSSYYITLGVRSGSVTLDAVENIAKFEVQDVDAQGNHFGFTQGALHSGYIDTAAEVYVS